MKILPRLAVVATAAALLMGLAPSAPALALPKTQCVSWDEFWYEEGEWTVVVAYCNWYVSDDWDGGLPDGVPDREPSDGGNSGPGGGGVPTHGGPTVHHPEKEERSDPKCEAYKEQLAIAVAAVEYAREAYQKARDRRQGNPVTQDGVAGKVPEFFAWQLSIRQVDAAKQRFIQLNGVSPLANAKDVTTGAEPEWEFAPSARGADALSQALDLEVEARQKYFASLNAYVKEEWEKAEMEINELNQGLGRLEDELRLLEQHVAQTCS